LPPCLSGNGAKTKHPIDRPAPGANSLREPVRDGTRKIAADKRNTLAGISFQSILAELGKIAGNTQEI
jgi:hypothetical protein